MFMQIADRLSRFARLLPQALPDLRADDADEHQAVVGVELHLRADGWHDLAFALDLGEEGVR